MAKQRTTDEQREYEEGKEHGLHPIRSVAEIVHQAVGTVPLDQERSEDFQEGKRDGEAERRGH